MSGPDVVRIDLGDGHQAVLDAADHPIVAGHSWRCLHTPTGRQYAATDFERRLVYMHRLIANTPDDRVTDHRNNDGLDNRRANLRTATRGQNNAHTGKRRTYAGRESASAFKGVGWDSARGRWRAHAKIDGRNRFLGRFDSEVEAARAYDAVAVVAWGEFAFLNFPAEHGQQVAA